jgi:hypothetical protein
MSPKQKKIAAKAPPPDKIDAKDFAVLKAEKAKGRGMGLQDESVQPGKVQKAFLGKMIKGAGKSIGRLFGAKKSATATPGTVTMSKSGIGGEGGMLPQLLQKAIDDGIIKPASKGRMMKAFKGGGADMGLQDEKVKPGKVMKAKTGKQIVKEFSASLKGIDESFKSKVHPMKKQRLLDRSTVMTKAKYGKMMKARVGKSIDKKAYMKTIGVFPTIDKVTPTVKGKQLPVAKNTTPLKALGRVMGSRAALLGLVGAGAAAGLNMAGRKLKEFADKKKVKKMAGGMAKKYSKGGDLRAEYIHSQTKKNRKVTGEGYFTERSATRREEYGAAKDRYPNKMDRRKQMLKNLSRVLNPTMGVVKGTIDALNAPTTRKYSVGGGMMNKPMGYSSGSKLMDFIKSGSYTDKYGTKTNVDKAIKKINLSPKDKDLATMKPASDKKMMGGGMMQRPMGYKSGTMVKARGCKLGRTRPTKMY